MSKLYDLLSAMCGKIKKSDWNQNDTTAADYVNNRTHYETITEQTIIEKQDFVFTTDYLFYFPTLSVYQYEPYIDYASLPIGNKVVVTFDSEVYNLEVKESANYDASMGFLHGRAIGNLSLLDCGDTDTGEPFLIYNNEYTGVILIDSPREADSETHTVSFKADVNIVKKIDYKYLPGAANETDMGLVKATPVDSAYGLLPVSICDGFLYVDALRMPTLFVEHDIAIPATIGQCITKNYAVNSEVYSALRTGSETMHYLQYRVDHTTANNFVEFFIYPTFGSLKIGSNYGIAIGADCYGSLYTARFSANNDESITMSLTRIA